MSFDRSLLSPNPEDHVPIQVHIPTEGNDRIAERPDIPPPTLWKRAVKVVNKIDGREAVVNRVDLGTMMFRAFYPEEGELGEDGKPVGRFADRTEWEQCRDWSPAVTLSEKAKERQAARELLNEEIAKLNRRELAAVEVLVDGDDPNKALAKLEALRALGIIGGSVEAIQAALEQRPSLPPEPTTTKSKGGK